MTDREQIEAARAVFDKTTPGEWEILLLDDDIGNVEKIYVRKNRKIVPIDEAKANCALIYASPALMRRVIELEGLLSTTEQERDVLVARCAELEARMQGAADREDGFDDSCSESWGCASECHAYNNGKCMNAIKCDGKPNYPTAQSTAAIVGKKEGV